MKFDWRRPLAPAVLFLGLLLCFARDPVVGLGIFLVSFALILGFSPIDLNSGEYWMEG
jgi:hypothetical protein